MKTPFECGKEDGEFNVLNFQNKWRSDPRGDEYYNYILGFNEGLRLRTQPCTEDNGTSSPPTSTTQGN